MSKFNDFYKKVSEDAALKAEVAKILAGEALDKASDEKLNKIGEIAKKAGFDLKLEDVKAQIASGELDEDELDAVAGGAGKSAPTCHAAGSGMVQN